jgi:hypothetical protein
VGLIRANCGQWNMFLMRIMPLEHEYLGTTMLKVAMIRLSKRCSKLMQK